MTVCHRNDLDGRVSSTIDHIKGESMQEITPGPLDIRRPSVRRLVNLTDGMVDLSNEGIGHGLAALPIPSHGLMCFGNRFWMKLQRMTRHQDPLQNPMMLRRASDHGIKRVDEEFSSFSRAAISDSHVASASGSTGSSRLSNKEPARAARASGGSLRASFKSLDVSVFMD